MQTDKIVKDKIVNHILNQSNIKAASKITGE